jgi:D-inositol-3-phosphate glycosyltransferase
VRLVSLVRYLLTFIRRFGGSGRLPRQRSMGRPDGGLRNVLIVSHYFPPHIGGIENVVQNEARHLAKEGKEVTVLTSNPDQASERVRRDDGFMLIRVRAWNILDRRWGLPFPLLSPEFVIRSWQLVRRADIVHVHDCLYLSSWITAVCCRLLRRPMVVTQHVTLVPHPRWLVEAVQQCVHRTTGAMVMRTASVITAINDNVRTFVVDHFRVPDEQVVVLRNGVDTSLFGSASKTEKRVLRERLGLPQDKTLVLFVGRFVPKKGADKLLKAAGDDYTLVLAGGEPVTGFETDPRVVFLGTVDPTRINDVYRSCDVFALPGESEIFPLVIQEAMASGLPVISSADPGYDTYALDPAGIRLIEPTVPNLRAVLHELAADPARREYMSAYSLRFAAEHFQLSSHLRELEAHYRAVLSDHVAA